jgi:guanine deaminase
VDRVLFAADRRDAARAGFDDAVFYRELQSRPKGKLLPIARRRGPGDIRPFDLWRSKAGKTPY